MFKRRFRLPSPALVISMITLSLVLGGTAVAASTATHKDKKADVKLIKKLAPTLSVKHAKTANSANAATHATSADSATNASHASTADTATTAKSLSTLAGGKSEGGYWSYVAKNIATGDFTSSTISFQQALASAPTPHLIRIGGLPPTGCSGTATAPVAAPGHLCMWETYALGVGVIDIYDFVSGNYNTANIWGTSLLERPSVANSLF